MILTITGMGAVVLYDVIILESSKMPAGTTYKHFSCGVSIASYCSVSRQ
jgi:hypothetical protein